MVIRWLTTTDGLTAGAVKVIVEAGPTLKSMRPVAESPPKAVNVRLKEALPS